MMRNKILSLITIVLCTLIVLLTSLFMGVPPVDAARRLSSKGGVRRGPCATEELASLVALAPDRALKLIPVGEKVASTVTGYPTFWFYLPGYPASIHSAKFVLLDESNHLLQQPVYAQLPPNSDGILAGLTLPAKGKALEVGKQYTWYFSILCDPFKPSRNPELIGQVQRSLPSSLPSHNTPAYVVYDSNYTGQNGRESIVFYDTVTRLIQQRQTYASAWNDLLRNAEIPNSVQPVELNLLDKPPEQCDTSNLS